MTHPHKAKKDYARQEFNPSTHRLFHDFSTLPRKILVGAGVALFLFFYTLGHRSDGPLIKVILSIEKVNTRLHDQLLEGSTFLKSKLESKEKLRSKIAALEKQLQTHEKQFFDIQQLREENEALRAILPLVRDRTTITVICKPKPSNPFLFVTYPGPEALEGIKPGALVLAPQGLVGTVVAKEAEEVVILLATQVQSKIPVRSQQSHKRALLLGQNTRFFALKYAHDEAEETASQEEGISSADRPFVKDSHIKEGFIEGEILELCDQPIPVARVVKRGKKILAEWLIKSPSKYLTILLK